MAKPGETGSAGTGPVVTSTIPFGTANGLPVTAISYSDGTIHLSVGGQDIAVETGTLTPAGTGSNKGAAATITLSDGRKVFLGSMNGKAALVSAGSQGENPTHIVDIPTQQQLTTQAGQAASGAPGVGGNPTVQQQQASQSTTTPRAGSQAGSRAASAGTTVPAAGGGGGGGVTIINQAPAAPAAPAATGVDWAALQQQYGYAAGLFQSNPELQGLVKQATAGKWTDQRFLAAVQNSKWWKTHTDAQRKYIVEKTGNPGQLNADRQQMSLSIANQAAKDGVQLPAARLAAMVEDALKGGWNQDQINTALAAEYKYNGSAPDATADALKTEAAKYLVPLSDQTVQQWARQIIAGTADQNTFDAYLKEQAKSLFPGLSGAIDSGVTVAQYTDPYRQLAAQTLGIAPDSINFMDPKWSQALFRVDPKTGARTSMSLSDWQRTLMTDPSYGWDSSANGRAAAADLATKLGRLMGVSS